MVRILVTLAALVVAAGSAVAQQKHNADAPLNVAADAIDLQDKMHRALLTGNVVIKQAEMTLSAPRVTVNYSGQVVDGQPQATRVDAAGGVLVQRPDQTARAQYGVYDLVKRTVTMLGGVTLTKPDGTVHGNRLVINLDTNQANLDGGNQTPKAGTPGVTTSSGGRVTGVFSVPKRQGQ
jgi:lipopolysaccharide export system protein LptA